MLHGGDDGSEELSASEFRFDSGQINIDSVRDLNEFTRADAPDELTRAIPIDVMIWWIQKRYRAKQRSG